ncbi:hypothetical protein CPLU01_02013 [Colletotrichum plurivorum]|uniref:Uncharacterized protein n=1 Tax=Colletotrichum plurivorum TaxID=2175906 RepID=A0A8H6KXB3_9PEZI|nr:hypothetical protein CPLU01_02013 [Colletotrichum plurivorum]
MLAKWTLPSYSWTRQGTDLKLPRDYRAAVTLGANLTKDRLVQDARGFLEDEAQSIEANYRPLVDGQVGRELNDATDDAIDLRCRDFGPCITGLLHSEKQERELPPETERERQIQRAPPAKPLPHRVHPDIDRLVSTGILHNKSEAVMPALMAFSKTTAAGYMDLSEHHWNLLVSVDYAQTIQVEGKAAVGAHDCKL